MTRELFRKLNIVLILFFAISFFVFVLLNGGAYARVLRYTIVLHLPFIAEDLRANDILEVAAAAQDTSGKNYQLVIPKIEVVAPIVAPLGEGNKAVLAGMEEGVALYPGSAQVGSPDGRSIILGHSSRASWYRGDYATIFALLSKLEPLDEFYVVGDGKKYTYRVFARQHLTPSETNAILAGPSSGSEIDLITCYPVGSASSRTLVRASLVRVEEL